MDLPYDALRAFAMVAEEQSFSRAGEKLLRSQSAISLKVAKLEACVGHRLLDRSTKHVALTEAGSVLLAYARQTEALLAHEIDLGIVTLRKLNPDIEALPLFPRHDVLICHPDHPLARRRRIFLKDLERYAFILLDERCSSRRLLDDLCAASRVELVIAMELSSIEVIKRFVRIDAGLSVVPAVAVQEEIDSGQLASVEIADFESAEVHDMGVVYKRNRCLSLAARSFLDELEETFGATPKRSGKAPARPRRH